MNRTGDSLPLVLFSLAAMRHRATLLFVLLSGGLAGCGASSPKPNGDAAELEARSARAEATREHAQLMELGARLLELEHRLATQTPACEATPVAVTSSGGQPRTEPLRSEGDFLAEARAVTPSAAPAAARAANVAGGTSPQPTTAASERQRLEQLLEQLREYGFDPRSGLSLERREALRILLRRERQLDLMNPWAGH
jgi:hypothetical protein